MFYSEADKSTPPADGLPENLHESDEEFQLVSDSQVITEIVSAVNLLFIHGSRVDIEALLTDAEQCLAALYRQDTGMMRLIKKIQIDGKELGITKSHPTTVDVADVYVNNAFANILVDWEELRPEVKVIAGAMLFLYTRGEDQPDFGREKLIEIMNKYSISPVLLEYYEAVMEYVMPAVLESHHNIDAQMETIRAYRRVPPEFEIYESAVQYLAQRILQHGVSAYVRPTASQKEAFVEIFGINRRTLHECIATWKRSGSSWQGTVGELIGEAEKLAGCHS